MLLKLRKLQQTSFKVRLILTFSAVTIIIVVIMSRVGYVSVREIYLNQISDQCNLLTRLIATRLNSKYLVFLNESSANHLASEYYQKSITEQAQGMKLPQIFIFNGNLEVLVQSDSTNSTGRTASRLLLNRSEIMGLQIGESTTSLPFQSDAGR